MRKVPFYLITGFLGSGKTTLLKNLLQQFAHSKKFGIIQNEFAPASIDGIDLKQTGFPYTLLEINNGSVFCVCLLANFIDSLAAFIVEKQPDVVFLESSGLSDPIAIAQLLQFSPLSEKLYLSHIWCVIDCINFLRTSVGEIQMSRQVRIADTVVLNKADLGSENMESIRNRIVNWNPHAEIVSSTHCNIHFDNLFYPFRLQPVASRIGIENSSFESCGRPENVKTAVLKTGKRIAPEKLDLFLQNEASNAYRMKGYVRLTTGNSVAVQSSFGQTSITEIAGYDGNTELISIGPQVDAVGLNKRFKSLASG